MSESRTLEYCTTESDGRILIVTINRPERMNALHWMANEELASVFDDFASNSDLWVAIITGAGDRAFSAGNDLKYQAQEAGGEMQAGPRTGFAGLTARYDCSKPIIAAVNGVAMGGGFEIALACDLIIASDKAVFALPEPRVGLAALAGGIHRLPRLIGLKRAMGMMLTGRRVGAEEGERMGFVNEVTAPDDLMPAARRWAEQILECSPLSVRATKQAAMDGLRHGLITDAMDERYPAIGDLFKSKDFIEGPLAFAEKRPPKWQGR